MIYPSESIKVESGSNPLVTCLTCHAQSSPERINDLLKSQIFTLVVIADSWPCEDAAKRFIPPATNKQITSNDTE